MRIGFFTRMLPHLSRTMTSGWQPPTPNHGAHELPKDTYTKGETARPRGQAHTHTLPKPQPNFLSRMLAHSAASSQFPEAISLSDIELLESVGPAAAPLRPSLPGLPASPQAPTFSLIKPATDQDWMKRFLAHTQLSNFPEAISVDDIEVLKQPESNHDHFDIPDFAINILKHKHSLADKIKLGSKSALALKLEEQLHLPDDKSVANDIFRKETTDSILKSGKKVVWSETTGLAEVGTGQAGTIPVGSIGKFGAGFKGSAMVQYRTVQPVTYQHGQNPDSLPSQQVFIPTTPEQLVGLAPGAEFEVTGKATVMGHASASLGHTIGTGPIRAAAKASVGGSVLHSGEVSLNMKILDSSGIVQVSLKKRDLTTEKLTADLFAGLESNLGIPNVGNGLLRHVIQNELTRPIAATIRNNASVSAGLKKQKESGGTDLVSYTIDLTSPNGLEACKSLMNLSTATAQTLSEIEGSGVSFKRLDTTSNRDRFRAHVSFGGTKLLLHKTLLEEKEVSFTGKGKKLIYRENQFQESTKNIITGSKNVTWDAVSVDRSGAEKDTTFFNMKFSSDKLYTSNNALRRFLGFSDLLSPTYKGEVDAELPEMSVIDRLLTNKDDAKVNVDIYFTEEGIRRIDQSGAKEARAAYLTVEETLRPSSKGLLSLENTTVIEAEEIAGLYADASAERFIPESGAQFDMARLESRYTNLTGRDLSKDCPTLLGSQNFSHHVNRLQGERGPEQFRAFFSELGQSTELDYMPALSALARLAGDEETLVHQLSLRGPSLNIDTVSEGKIAHPATTISKLMEAQRLP